MSLKNTGDQNVSKHEATGSDDRQSARSSKLIADEAPPEATPLDDPRLPRIREQLTWLSDRLSTQSRVVAAGALAVVWAVLSGDADKFNPNRLQLFWLSVFAIILLSVDFIQYLAAYWQQRFRLRAVQRGLQEERFVELLFWLREASFQLKCILVIVTGGLLIATAASTLSPVRQTQPTPPKANPTDSSPKRLEPRALDGVVSHGGAA